VSGSAKLIVAFGNTYVQKVTLVPIGCFGCDPVLNKSRNKTMHCQTDA